MSSTDLLSPVSQMIMGTLLRSIPVAFDALANTVLHLLWIHVIGTVSLVYSDIFPMRSL